MDRHGIDQVVREQMLHLNAFRATPKMIDAARNVLSIWVAGDHVDRGDTADIRFLAKKFPFKGRAYTWSASGGPWLGWTRKPTRGSVVIGHVEGLDVAALAKWAKRSGVAFEFMGADDFNALIAEGSIAGTKAGTNLKPYSKRKFHLTPKPAPKKPARKKPAPKKRKVGDKPLKGKTFLFTGKLASGLTRDEAAKLVRKAGGTVVTHVAKGLDYLVAGAEGSLKYKKGGGKFTKVKKLQSEGSKVRVLSEKAFLKFFGL